MKKNAMPITKYIIIFGVKKVNERMIVSSQWTENEGALQPGGAVSYSVKRRRVGEKRFVKADTAFEPESKNRVFDAVQSMHAGFTETLRAMASDNSPDDATVHDRGPRQHALYKSIMSRRHMYDAKAQASVEPEEVELVLRADEEAFMRPVADGETPCASGELCEARLIARYVYEGAVAGFTCPAFVLPRANVTCGDLCVLCLRKAVSVQLYTLRSWNKTPPTLILPYRNAVDVDGEYRAGACLYPSRRAFEGVSDPFLRHQRHRYVYQDGVIRHSDAVLHFRSAPLRAPSSPPPSAR